MDDGRTTDGRRHDGHTISSPCEPNGLGELKNNLFKLKTVFGAKTSIY